MPIGTMDVMPINRQTAVAFQNEQAN